MAITWECKISKVNIQGNRADVTFKRIDDETGKEWSVSYSQAIIETSEQRDALFDKAWTDWQEALGKQTEIKEFIGSLEQSAKANLETREV